MKFFWTSPILSGGESFGDSFPAISSTNRHPLVHCADSTSICPHPRLYANSNLNELNMGHEYSYSQPSESEEYGGYTVDSGYSETEDLIRQDQAEISYNKRRSVPSATRG
ncbi:hypothetical protein Bca52824_095434 [Brassica carinata]|uniref:Uncharacterized protein n=1 Tax=Brassica carinata TaxID=52824 RepID=A0A8X7TJS5_BRACI|nr:hypothetical protein Bca52824_095434 [Brassica carinata]